jgi:hypothetical protein
MKVFKRGERGVVFRAYLKGLKMRFWSAKDLDLFLLDYRVYPFGGPR